MCICVDDLNWFVGQFNLENLLTFVALLLAYIAYQWSVDRDLESWKSLFISLKKDLECQSSWLDSEYFAGSYRDKNSFNPYKIVYPLSFESLPEIIRRGIAEIGWIPESFLEKITLFNERVIAFNQVLDYMKLSCTSNPIVAERLKTRLNEIGLEKPDVQFNDFKKKIHDDKSKDEVLYLAEQTRRLNRILHTDLIGSQDKEDKLNYLYTEIIKELKDILDVFDRKKPFVIKYRNLMIIFSILIFVLLEFIF
jgi:hypothetical protein